MPYHKILEAQIHKKLTSTYLEDPVMLDFLDMINRSYYHFERDKKLSEHAFSISEKEYQEVLHDLEVQNDIKDRSIQKIKEAIVSLEPHAMLPFNKEDDELISVITYLEQQLRKSKELEAELVKAKEIAEKAARAKSDFLSVMSHEIRTPLNAITGIIHLMMQEDPIPGQSEHLNILNISAENLLSLINDLLDFGKIEEGRIVFSEKNMSIRRLVNNLKHANRIRAQEKGNVVKVMIDEDLPEFVTGDELRLGQILNNLITNAIKFTRNGSVTIEVHVAGQQENAIDVFFSVTDTGIGIDPEKQKLIFERFTQADSDISRQYGGSGLGLAIIQRLLQLQHSDIRLESEPGKGSRFFFALRFKKSTRPAPEKKQAGPANLAGVKILLVDDVEFNIMVAEKMLLSQLAVVDIASNGQMAIDMAKEKKYDIILMDLQMPIVDGYNAAKTIRALDQHIPIIALTASASVDIQQKALEHGMNDYLAKPFNPVDLYDTVHRYTNGGKL